MTGPQGLNIFDELPEHVVAANPEGLIIYANPAAEKAVGFSLSEMLGKKPGDVWGGRMEKSFYSRMWNKIAIKKEPFVGIVENKRKDGTFYKAELRVYPILNDSGEVKLYLAIEPDVTARIEVQRAREQAITQLKNDALRDPLTGLPNRRLLEDRLRTALGRAKRHDKRRLALMFVDLDKFKEVNDTLGHDMGDLLIKEAGRRMSDCLRSEDTVARIGGDEFIILIPEFIDNNDVLDIAKKISNQMSTPFSLNGQEIKISCSMGIAIYPFHGMDSASLVKSADIALYQAKNSGRNRYRVYN